MRWLFAIWLVAGCDRVFQLTGRDDDAPIDATEIDSISPEDAIDASLEDLDGDGMPDVADDCIAPPSDAEGNYDNDTRNGVPYLNGVDTCAFNTYAVGSDTDSDNIDNSCDPHTSTPGDRSRCTMVFTSVGLNAQVWRPRPTEGAWGTIAGELDVTPTPGLPTMGVATTLAAHSLEGPNEVSYHAIFQFEVGAGPGSLTLWLRADPTLPGTSDLGCRYRNESGVIRLGVIGAGGFLDPRTMTAGVVGTNYPNELRMHATMATSGTVVTVTCSANIGATVPVTSMAQHPLPPATARAGFTADRWKTRVRGLQVFDRPDP